MKIKKTYYYININNMFLNFVLFILVILIIIYVYYIYRAKKLTEHLNIYNEKGMKKEGELCANDEECDGKLYCGRINDNDDTEQRKCLKTKGIDNMCTVNSECEYGLICVSDSEKNANVCKPAGVLNAQCDIADDCHPDFYCKNNKCTPKIINDGDCSNPSDVCRQDYFCNDSKKCEYRKDLTIECKNTYECRAGLKCNIDGRCVYIDDTSAAIETKSNKTIQTVLNSGGVDNVPPTPLTAITPPAPVPATPATGAKLTQPTLQPADDMTSQDSNNSVSKKPSSTNKPIKAKAQRKQRDRTSQINSVSSPKKNRVLSSKKNKTPSKQKQPKRDKKRISKSPSKQVSKKNKNSPKKDRKRQCDQQCNEIPPVCHKFLNNQPSNNGFNIPLHPMWQVNNYPYPMIGQPQQQQMPNNYPSPMMGQPSQPPPQNYGYNQNIMRNNIIPNYY